MCSRQRSAHSTGFLQTLVAHPYSEDMAGGNGINVTSVAGAKVTQTELPSALDMLLILSTSSHSPSSGGKLQWPSLLFHFENPAGSRQRQRRNLQIEQSAGQTANTHLFKAKKIPES